MSKNNFRLLIVASLLLALLSGGYDYLWPDTVSEQIIEYAYEIEPEIVGTKLVVLVVIGVIATIFAVVSFFGLLLFKSWAKPMYLAGFVLFMPLYPFMGVTVYSGISQILYDLSVIASGAILAMLYFSPVSELYRSKNLTNQGSRTASPPAA